MSFYLDLNVKPIHITIPNDIKKLNITYPLISPYAYANIKYDPSKYDIVYNVIEPTLSKSESTILYIVEDSLKEIVDIDISDIKTIKNAITYLEGNVRFVLDEYGIKLSDESFNKIMYYVFRDFYGYGKIEPLMHDVYIEDIECSGVNLPIFVVHRKFGTLETNIVFDSEESIRELIEKFALRTGKFVSYSEPFLDATLPDGSRINATYSSDVTTRGPTFTIRKFRKTPWTPLDLVRLGTVSIQTLAYLWLAIEHKKNIIIIGGTASGKTTMLNAISMFIPPNSRIVSIEDTREIQLYHENWIPAVVRYSHDKEREINMFTLLKESFRQNPDYVIVGEVRGQEAYVMFQGMASGHAALSTMHATSVSALINRLTTPPINLPRVLIELLDIVMIMRHDVTINKNTRRLIEVDEIIDADNYNPVFRWNAYKNSYESSSYSVVLSKISREYGYKYEDLIEEYKNRIKLLSTLNSLGISNYKIFSRIIRMYYLDKYSVLKYYNII